MTTESHHPCLTTNGNQNMDIAVDKDNDFEGVVSKEVPDSVDQLSLSGFIEHVRIADAVDHVACEKRQGEDVDKTADPRE